jgi:Tfp pilus assembly protein PilN
MKRILMVLAVFGVALSGVWGCARGPVPAGTAAVERIKALEEKNARLEEENRAAAASSVQFKRKLTETEEQQTRLQQDVETLQTAAKERDQLKQVVQQRTGERDALSAQFETFRKTIREALGTVETSTAAAQLPAPAPTPAPAATPVAGAVRAE